MLLFTTINILGVRRFSDTNTIITWWKILIPAFTIVVLMATAFHPGNFTAGGGFAPYGAKGVLSALPTGGIIFALLGFETAVALAGESRNPRRDVPLAVVGAMIVGTIIYVFLQVAFLGALPHAALAHGWAKLGITGHDAIAFGPFAGLAGLLGLGWLATLLYADAIVSPGGTSLVYVAYSSRLWYALARNGYLPRIFARLSGRGVPVASIAVSFIVGMIIFLPFPGWSKLVGFVTSATVLAYAMTPLAFAALRRQEPERERPYRLPLGEVIAPITFIIANLIVYWTGWDVDWKIFLAVGLGFIILIGSRTAGDAPNVPLDWRSALWFWPYVGGMAIISFLGSFPGGRNVIPFGVVDTAVVVIFSVAIYILALNVRLPADRVQEYVGQLQGILEGETDDVPTRA
jgi:amino acid transporter